MRWRWSAPSRCTPPWAATRRASASCSPRRWWRARCGSTTAWRLLALAPVLLYWQLETPINDVSELAGDPSVNASYYAPLLGELQHRAHGAPLRVEVPQTGAHWESVYLPEHGSILLARGWERQLDTRYAALFYAPTLTPAAYRAWLYENAISYVALPDVRLDFSGAAEGRLIARGLPYLREVWRSPHWRLFAVVGAPGLATAPARLQAVGADSFTLAAPRPGSYEVRVRYTPYWALQRGARVRAQRPGRLDHRAGAHGGHDPRGHRLLVGAHLRPRPTLHMNRDSCGGNATGIDIRPGRQACGHRRSYAGSSARAAMRLSID